MAVFSGMIHVLERARKWSVCREAKVEMVPAFLTVDWQFVLRVQCWWRMSKYRNRQDYSLEQCVCSEILSGFMS